MKRSYPKDEEATTELFNDLSGSSDVAPFSPRAHGLPANFRLTKYSGSKSRGTKPSTEVEESLMAILKEAIMEEQRVDSGENDEEHREESTMTINKTLLQRDPSRKSIIETSEVWTPFIDDPYAMGKIACLSVLSGIYTLGIVEIATNRMRLAIPASMGTAERDIAIPMIIRGYRDAAIESGTRVECADISNNRCCQIGGTATALYDMRESILLSPAPPPLDEARLGDVILLTKPLGTSIALTASNWLEQPEKRKILLLTIDERDVIKAKCRALDFMLQSNRESAVLMKKYNAHAACQVSSRGILGDAMKLVKRQRNPVTFVIHNLPIIAKMNVVAKLTGDFDRLVGGTMPEYSGGLILVLPREQAAAYCTLCDKSQERRQGWIIGLVEEGEKIAKIIYKPRIIPVPAKENDSQLW